MLVPTELLCDVFYGVHQVVHISGPLGSQGLVESGVYLPIVPVGAELGAHRTAYHPYHQLHGHILAQFLLAYQCVPRPKVQG